MHADLYKAVLRKTRQEKATEQSMTQVIMQTAIKATKVAIMVVRETDNWLTCLAQVTQH